ncbi:MAG: VWA domain-containing protein [Verrucomicrobia bacterium]|nr:VWA domain-containing protein [Verrucomicrobiota bacterium]
MAGAVPAVAGNWFGQYRLEEIAVRYANPQTLWLLLVVLPLLLAFLWWAWRKRQRLITQFIQSRLLAGLMAGVSLTRRKIRLGLIVLAVTLSLVALARPQWGFDWEEVKQRGLDIVVAIDTSRSMLAEDVKPDRLTKAKYAALDLMQQARSDRLGLVAFAGTAFLQCPLTVDDEAFRQSVNALDVNIIPQGGTALAAAIDTALAAFKDEADNYKVLVLITDGEDHDSAALDAAKKAAKAGLRIFTIGIGTADGELLRIRDEKGNLDYVKDDQGNVVKSRLNEALLQQIAGATEGGFYLPLRGAKTIDTLYERGLAPLPKSDLTTKHVRRYHERFHWPLAAVILLLLAEMFLPERKRKVQPAASTAATANAALREAVTVLIVVFLPATLLASPSSALRQYEAGKYENALKEYQELLKRKADDPRLHFNAGASAYQNKQFDEAAKEFNEVLSARDLQMQQRGYYNLGNTLYQLGENNPDPTKKIEAWENSVKSFDSALQLNPQDADAKFNSEFVKKKLEELKKQQPQSSQNQSKQQKDQQKDQKQDQSKNDSKKDEAKNSQSEQKKDPSQSQQNSQSQKEQEQKSEQQKQADAQSKEKKDQADKKKESQDKASAQPRDKTPDQNGEGQPTALAEGQMTPQQALQLLDAQKGDEKVLPIPIVKQATPNRLFKNW